MASCMPCAGTSATTVTVVEELQNDGLSRDIQALRDLLAKKEHMISSVKLHHSAIEATMTDLDDQVQLARYAIDDIVQKLQIQVADGQNQKDNEVLLIPVNDAPVDLDTAATTDVAGTPPPDAVNPASSVTAVAVASPTTSAPAGEEKPDDLHERDPTSFMGKLQSDMVKTVALPAVELGLWQFVRAVCRKLVVEENGRAGKCFEYGTCFVIIVNSILIGIEADLSISNDTTSWAAPMEIVFLTLYTLELIIRLIAKGVWKNLRDPWFRFDLALIVLTFVGLVSTSLSPDLAPALQQVLVLRAVRLLRLIRAFRMIKQLRTVWRLVYGLFTSGETMLSTLALLSLVLYVFAVLGVESITKDDVLQADPATKAILDQNFSSLYVTMVSLTQFATMDSIAAIYLPLIKKKGELAIYFCLLVIIVSISLMNLVTAVIVEGALDHARQDREDEQRIATARAKNMLTEISDLFNQLDKDGNTIIHLSEVERADREKQVAVPSSLLDKASVESISELFHKLDVDGSGNLTREEFTEGLLNIFLLDVPVADMQVMKMMRLMRTGVKKIDADLADLKRFLAGSSSLQLTKT